MELLVDVTTTVEPVGTFLWPSPTAQEALPFRYHASEEDRRSVDEIAMPELVGLVRDNPSLAISDDPAFAFAREIGLARLAQAARARLEDAVRVSVSGSAG